MESCPIPDGLPSVDFLRARWALRREVKLPKDSPLRKCLLGRRVRRLVDLLARHTAGLRFELECGIVLLAWQVMLREN